MDLCIVKEVSEIAEASMEKNQTLFICFDWKTKNALLGRGLNARLYDERIEANEAEKADRLIFDLSKEWHYFRVRDFTEVGGISLGKAWEWMVWWSILAPAYKFVLALKLVLEQERPERLLCDNSVAGVYRRIIEDFAKRHGIKISFFGEHTRSADLDALGAIETGWKLTRVDWWRTPLLTLYSLAASLRRMLSARKSDEKSVLVFPYPSLSSLFLEWQRESRGLRLFVISVPQRLGVRFLLGRLPELARLEANEVSEHEKVELEELRKDWERIRMSKEYRKKFEFCGINPFDAIAPFLDKFFSHEIDSLAQQGRGCREVLDQKNIAFVLLPFDTTPLHAMMIQVAREKGIPTAVMLHGLPMRLPFDDRADVGGDYLFVWGESEREEYSRHKRKDRIVVLGNPYFDNYLQSSGGETTERKRPTILVLSNPRFKTHTAFSDAEPEEYARTLVKTISGLDADIVFKLHPSESLKYYGEVLSKYASRVRILRREPIRELIEQADVIVCPFTTVLMEVMLYGKPIVCVNFSKIEYPKPFDGKSGFLIARSTREVEGQVRKILSQGQEREAYAKILEYCAGKVDNHASERVLDEVARIIRNSI